MKLGLAFAVRHAIPSAVSASGFIMAFAILHAIDDTGIAKLGVALPAALTFVGEHYLEALQAAVAMLIIVRTIRHVLKHAAADTAFALDLDWSFRNPLVRTAFRSSWLVFALLGALYILLAVSGSIIAEGGPRNILLIPVYLVVMPLTTGGPIGLLIIYSLVGAGIFVLGLLAAWTVRNVLLESGAASAARIDVFKPLLNRPLGVIRLVLNLTWLYGVPFILFYRWVPTLLLPPTPLTTFSQVQAGLEGNAQMRSWQLPFLESAYEGAAIAIGLVFAALAAVIVWNRAAQVALHAEPRATTSVERTRPWHDPETPMTTALKTRTARPGASFGKRSA